MRYTIGVALKFFLKKKIYFIKIRKKANKSKYNKNKIPRLQGHNQSINLMKIKPDAPILISRSAASLFEH